jgi:hypothetical protein
MEEARAILLGGKGQRRGEGPEFVGEGEGEAGVVFTVPELFLEAEPVAVGGRWVLREGSPEMEKDLFAVGAHAATIAESASLT